MQTRNSTHASSSTLPTTNVQLPSQARLSLSTDIKPQAQKSILRVSSELMQQSQKEVAFKEQQMNRV
jgi:hypothetical protein